jgi:succinate dehydrogenase flavin-adding protein (antitoxin of CptAB toxin-antitoxin module)
MTQLTEFRPNLYYKLFDNSQTLGYTFLRFQEHFESPKFKNKIFTLKEYKVWFKQENNTKQFTYCNLFDGFNLPDYVFTPFLNGKFNPLSKNEKSFLNEVKLLTPPFYIIGLSYVKNRFFDIFNHELAHGFFYLNKNYKNEMINLINQLPKNIYKHLTRELLSMGYHKEHIVDEIQAYCQSDDEILSHFNLELFECSKETKTVFKQIQKKFQEYYNDL